MGQADKDLRADVGELLLADDSQHVLVPVEVHSRLSSHRGIHLSQQGRRHIGEAHSPLVDRRGKSDHVAGHSAAYRKDEGIAVRTVIQKPGTYLHHRVHGLRLFRGIDQLSRHTFPVHDSGHFHGRRAVHRDIAVHDRKYMGIPVETFLKFCDILLDEYTADDPFS